MMPLIDITINPGSWVIDPQTKGQAALLRDVVWNGLGPSLPALVTNNKDSLLLDEETPASAVQVVHHTFGAHDINTPDLWIKVQLSEQSLELSGKWLGVRDAFIHMITNWFRDGSYAMPQSYAIDILWGPMHGVVGTNEGQMKY